MRWRFWQQRERQHVHTWSDWSDPAPLSEEQRASASDSTFGLWNIAAIPRNYAQARRCLTCNFAERHYL